MLILIRFQMSLDKEYYCSSVLNCTLGGLHFLNSWKVLITLQIATYGTSFQMQQIAYMDIKH